MPTYGWLLDDKRCIECRACETACKQWNGVETGANIRWRRVRTYESGQYPKVTTWALSISCNHCDTPWCAMSCPVKAISRRSDGIVLIDSNKCVGCQQCAKFCPYGAPQFDKAKMKTTKCTMCVDRLAEGLQPACATLCPTGALQWGKWEDVQSKGAPNRTGFAKPEQTKPAIRFVDARWGNR
jgi:DMSO reductase iron-sulfur subunit